MRDAIVWRGGVRTTILTAGLLFAGLVGGPYDSTAQENPFPPAAVFVTGSAFARRDLMGEDDPIRGVDLQGGPATRTVGLEYLVQHATIVTQAELLPPRICTSDSAIRFTGVDNFSFREVRPITFVKRRRALG